MILQPASRQTSTYYAGLAEQTQKHLSTKTYFSDTAEGVVQNYKSLFGKIDGTRKHARQIACALSRLPDMCQHMGNADQHFVLQYLGKKIGKNADGTYLGNCGEKAFHAYCHLLKKIKPEDCLALIMVENLKTNENHAILLLNANIALDKPYHALYPSFYLISNQPQDWGPDAVIYDPTFGTISENQMPFSFALFENQEPGSEPDTVQNHYSRMLSTDPLLQREFQFVLVTCNFNPKFSHPLFVKEILQEKRAYFQH